jgi:hypothetical protein
MTVSCGRAPHGLVEVSRRLRGAGCLHHMTSPLERRKLLIEGNHFQNGTQFDSDSIHYVRVCVYHTQQET